MKRLFPLPSINVGGAFALGWCHHRSREIDANMRSLMMPHTASDNSRGSLISTTGNSPKNGTVIQKDHQIIQDCALDGITVHDRPFVTPTQAFMFLQRSCCSAYWFCLSCSLAIASQIFRVIATRSSTKHYASLPCFKHQLATATTKRSIIDQRCG